MLIAGHLCYEPSRNILKIFLENSIYFVRIAFEASYMVTTKQQNSRGVLQNTHNTNNTWHSKEKREQRGEREREREYIRVDHALVVYELGSSILGDALVPCSRCLVERPAPRLR